jgi:hypothetical protein
MKLINKVAIISKYIIVFGVSTLILLLAAFILFMFFRDSKWFQIIAFATGFSIIIYTVFLTIYHHLTSQLEYIMYYFDEGRNSFINSYIKSLEETEEVDKITKKALINDLRILQEHFNKIQ